MDSTRSAVPEREDIGTPRALTPSQGRERIELVDAVRGFALYGVLLANLIWLTQDGAVVPAQLPGDVTGFTAGSVRLSPLRQRPELSLG